MLPVPLFAFALWAGQHTASSQFDRNERPIRALIVFLAPSAPTRLNVERAREKITFFVERGTQLEVVSEEQIQFPTERLRACESARAFSCWTKIAHEHESFSPQNRSPVRFLIMLSTSPQEDSLERLTVLVLDLKTNERLISSGESEQEIEDAIFASTLSARSENLSLDKHAGVEEFLDYAFSGPLRSAFEGDAVRSCSGIVELSVNCPTCFLRLDDTEIGQMSEGVVRISGLCSGRRQLAVLSRQEELICVVDILTSESRALITRDDCESRSTQPSEHLSESRSSVVFWSGISASAVGLVLSIRSPFRVDEKIGDGPRELLDNHLQQRIHSVAKWGSFPISAMRRKVEAPQMHSVAPNAKVLHGIVLGPRLDNNRGAIFSST